MADVAVNVPRDGRTRCRGRPSLLLVEEGTEPTHLERNIVLGDRVHRWFVRAAAHLRPAAIHAAATPAAASATQQGNAIGLHFSRISLVAVLVVPLTGLQAPLDVDLLALGQVLLQALCLLAPENDAVPLCLLLLLIVAVVPDLRRREIECGDGGAAGRIAELRIATEVADEDNLVDAAHVVPFEPRRGRGPCDRGCRGRMTV